LVAQLSDDVKTVVQSLLTTSAQCRHCNDTANLEHLGDGLVAAHVCPGRYVTRIIKYGKQLEPDEFKKFVQEAVQDMGRVENSDVRMASRYAWDLGLVRKNNDLILREIYWTQNYRRTKSDSPDRLALFLCSNKDSFFVQPLKASERFCRSCRK
jgi:hypothetical protein